MGVNGLRTFLENAQPPMGTQVAWTGDIAAEAPSTGCPPLVVDHAALWHTVLAQGSDQRSHGWQHAGGYAAFAARLRSMFEALLAVAPTVTVVFDGPAPSAKTETARSRHAERTDTARIVGAQVVRGDWPELTGFHGTDYPLPKWAGSVAHTVVEELEAEQPRLQLHQSKGEGDIDAAELAMEQGGLVVTGDTDFSIFQCPGWIFLPSLEVHRSEHGRVTVRGTTHSAKQLMDRLGVPRPALPLVSCLLGNDEVQPEDRPKLRAYVTALLPCKFGRECTRRETCPYSHQPELLANFACTNPSCRDDSRCRMSHSRTLRSKCLCPFKDDCRNRNSPRGCPFGHQRDGFVAAGIEYAKLQGKQSWPPEEKSKLACTARVWATGARVRPLVETARRAMAGGSNPLDHCKRAISHATGVEVTALEPALSQYDYSHPDRNALWLELRRTHSMVAEDPEGQPQHKGMLSMLESREARIGGRMQSPDLPSVRDSDGLRRIRDLGYHLLLCWTADEPDATEEMVIEELQDRSVPSQTPGSHKPVPVVRTVLLGSVTRPPPDLAALLPARPEATPLLRHVPVEQRRATLLSAAGAVPAQHEALLAACVAEGDVGYSLGIVCLWWLAQNGDLQPAELVAIAVQLVCGSNDRLLAGEPRVWRDGCELPDRGPGDPERPSQRAMNVVAQWHSAVGDFESLSDVLGIDGAEPFDPVDFTACDGVLSHLLLESVAASSAETLLQQTGPFRPAVEGLLEAVAPGAGDLVEGMAALAV